MKDKKALNEYDQEQKMQSLLLKELYNSSFFEPIKDEAINSLDSRLIKDLLNLSLLLGEKQNS